MENFKFELGWILSDKITGFKGTVTGRAQYLTGCSQYCLLPKSDDMTKMPEGQWIDENRLQAETDLPIILQTEETKGGPQQHPNKF